MNQNTQTEPLPLDPFTIIGGGTKLPVRNLEGVEELIKVRLLPVNVYPDFALVLGDEVGQVALFCDRDRAWAEKLHPASHDEIMTVGNQLNLSFFERWVSRQLARQAANPAMSERVERLAVEVLREELTKRLPPVSPSPSSSPGSPGSPAAA